MNKKKSLLGAITPREFDALVNKASGMSGMPASQLLHTTRGTERTSQWRMALYYVMRNRGATFQEIANYFARTHGAIIHGCNSIAEQAKQSTLVSNILDQLGSTEWESIDKEPTQRK